MIPVLSNQFGQCLQSVVNHQQIWVIHQFDQHPLISVFFRGRPGYLINNYNTVESFALDHSGY